jgi:deoxyribodipyrimidine photolyase-like uncharacterized protein
MKSGRLILVLGDQLTPQLSSLRLGDPTRDIVLIAEVMKEATYVRHHVKKLAFVFSSMRHFAEELRLAGWQVDYVRLDDPENTGSLEGEVGRAKMRHGLSHTLATERCKGGRKLRWLQTTVSYQTATNLPPGLTPAKASGWSISIARCAASWVC